MNKHPQTEHFAKHSRGSRQLSALKSVAHSVFVTYCPLPFSKTFNFTEYKVHFGLGNQVSRPLVLRNTCMSCTSQIHNHPD
ncbi:hypothetical protein GDO86_002358 [Hymenochirus boettgeri]|uniref:Uncharacterized protein n=1 Tax=Hymenochirus boettgeri TaxID=247094 RepID=A0A8T2KKK7_9PIPI|nr:hypothetical protein GDO86_002358 [Hymenochirus boettgeri]